MITPQHFDPNAGTAGYDSTAAIAAAIAEAQAIGGEVLLPATASGYLISNGFTIVAPMSIRGEGNGSNFVGSLPANVDLFHIVPSANTTLRSLSFDHFKISLTGGANWFHLDTNAVNTNLAEVEIKRISATAPGLNGIFVDNAPTNANGGTFNSLFEVDYLVVNNPNGACINISNGGDSITIRGPSILTGNGYGVLSNQVSGAGNLVIDGMNCTATGGIAIQRAIDPILINFEMEFSSMLTGAGINFVGPVDGGTIGPGQIQVLVGPFLGELLYLNNSNNVEISGVRFASGAAGIAINITSSCRSTRIGMNNEFLGFGSSIILDHGIATNYASAT